MGTGSIVLAMNRAQVVVDGAVVAKSATVTVRGNDAVAIDRGAGVELHLAVASVARARKSATVVGTDGTVWHLTRPGGCGCGK